MDLHKNERYEDKNKEFSCRVVFIYGSGDLVSPGNLFIRDTISEEGVWV